MADKPLSWVIRHLSGLGYDAIEIVCGPQAHLRPDDVTERDLEVVREELAAAGLRCAAINPYTVKPFVEMEREGGAQPFFRRLIDIALALGAPTVNFLPGRLPSSDADGWRLLVSTLKPLLHYAGEQGICLSIHNHEDHILDTPDKVRLIIEQVGLPNLKSLFDATNFHLLGAEIPWAVRRLAPHLQHCHLKGVLGRFPFHHFMVPGEPGDEFDAAQLVEALAWVGYSSCLSVETFSWMREDKAALAAAYLRPLLERAPVLEVGA